MAKISDKELDAQIKNGEFSNVYLIYGEESFLKEQYVIKLRKKLVDPAFSDFNFHHYEGKNASLDEILMTAQVMPMFSEYSLVLVHDYPLDKAPSDVNRLKEYFEDTPESCVLVFWFDNINVDDSDRSGSWTKIISLFDMSGCVVNFKRKGEDELVKRVIAKTKRSGAKIDANRARYLVSIVGTDMQTLLGELEKILAFVGEGEITKKEIDLLATPSLETNIYRLSAYIMKGDSFSAYQLIGGLLHQKEKPEDILSRLSEYYIDMYRAKCAKTAKVNEQTVATDFAYPKSRAWVVGKAGKDSAPYSLKTLRKAIDVLTRTDELMKSSSVNGQLLLEETVAKLLILRNR